MRARLAFCLRVLTALASCGEPGRVRVTERELVGNYAMEFQGQGKERLILSPDKTYLQVFASPARQFTNRGAWKSSNDFLGGTEIELVRANLSEDDLPGSPPRFGTVFLQVHRERGQLKLARNEAADWYYDRVR